MLIGVLVKPWITRTPIFPPGRVNPAEFGMEFTLEWCHRLA
ncbi:MAG: hypothetical protein RIS16_886 [Actinomycetota bacterium]